MMAHIVVALVKMLAKTTAPARTGTGEVFPGLSEGLDVVLHETYWFQTALLAQLVIQIGFFMFFRKGQLSKP